ncbi:hypothetical protein RHGRI_014344 [Rhododendron griersonianum]|uniref:Uncharacterized protein n=1 Tax=Rhododendron griersonianum TaxID=479676 RepID=A0AAV6K912_9ERIC|nr:hypothetical protein RHGRI_014344 [Rhododendron griersonianum]
MLLLLFINLVVQYHLMLVCLNNYGFVSPVTRYGDSYGFGCFPFGIMFLHLLPILFVWYQVVRLGIVWEFRWVTYLHHLSHHQRVDILLFHLLIGYSMRYG